MSFETLQPNANEEREYIRHVIKSFDLYRDETFRNMWVNFDRGIVGTYAMPKQNGQMYELLELKFYKAKGWDTQKVSEFLTDNPQYAPQYATEVKPPIPLISKPTPSPVSPVSVIGEGIISRQKLKNILRENTFNILTKTGKTEFTKEEFHKIIGNKNTVNQVLLEMEKEKRPQKTYEQGMCF